MTKRTLGAALALIPLLTACGPGDREAHAPAAAPQTRTAAVTMQGSDAQHAAAPLAPTVPQPNREGTAMTFSTAGGIDRGNPFFKPLGNGRSCASCHAESDGWTITPVSLRTRFLLSLGTDPVFRVVDGANSPTMPVKTVIQRTVAYSMLLTRGVIRIGSAIPAGAEFSLVAVDDPYRFASAAELSLFRRPLPATNLKFAGSVMWDGRETFADAAGPCIKNTDPPLCWASQDSNLLEQANSAVRGHAEFDAGMPPADLRRAVDFEKALFTAQLTVEGVGSVLDAGGLGGPFALPKAPFWFGINDVDAGDYQTGAPFNSSVFQLYGAWINMDRPGPRNRPASDRDRARAAVARGERIFNTREIDLSTVPGFGDELKVASLRKGTCASCHSVPSAGSHGLPRMFNLGVSDAALRTRDMPLYTLRNNATGETVQSTDPGAAMVTGKWKDIGKFKVPGLRGLSARPPYFHNGSAATAEDVVVFYQGRFNMGLTAREMADLAAFLKAL